MNCSVSVCYLVCFQVFDYQLSNLVPILEKTVYGRACFFTRSVLVVDYTLSLPIVDCTLSLPKSNLNSQRKIWFYQVVRLFSY